MHCVIRYIYLIMFEDNPLVLEVLSILKDNNKALGLYDLMQLLEGQGYQLEPTDASVPYELKMFHKNFVIMNALYQIQVSLEESSQYLLITPLHIELYDRTESLAQELSLHESDIEVDQKMSDYYLDWDNLNNTSQKDVKLLLESFWKRYADYQKGKVSSKKQLDALEILGLESGASWEDIQRSYRLKVSSSHPDKGGEDLHFIAIREAYLTLKFIYRKSS